MLRRGFAGRVLVALRAMGQRGGRCRFFVVELEIWFRVCLMERGWRKGKGREARQPVSRCRVLGGSACSAVTALAHVERLPARYTGVLHLANLHLWHLLQVLSARSLDLKWALPLGCPLHQPDG